MAAIVVLLLTFGSLIAMGLPIVTALFGLGTGLGAIALFTHVVDTPDFSSELAAMIGLGVGIDYALFILTRFREAYATPGPTFETSRESVVRRSTPPAAPCCSPARTVVIALLGMMLLGVTFLYGVAISASIGVLLVMLASLTLLPALLTLAGARGWQCGATQGQGARRGRGVGGGRRRRPHRLRHRLDALERLRPSPPRHDRGGLGADHAPDRRSRCGPAPRVQRRGERPREPDHPPRLRDAGQRLRPGLQRPAHDRGADPAAEPAGG